jgi:hypothetical protein
MWKRKRAPRGFALTSAFFALFGLLLMVVLIAGCKKSTPADESAKPKSAPPSTLDPRPSTLSRIHWLGKKRIAAETNAVGFMRIWNLPESARLEAQTLDKLALALGNQLPITNPPASGTNQPTVIINYHAFLNGPSALLRPLLDDLVQEESYVEIRGTTNQLLELALAIKLSEQRAGLWQANLAGALESLSGAKRNVSKDGRGWQLEFKLQGSAATARQRSESRSTSLIPSPSSISLSRAGDWTVVGFGMGASASLPAGSSRSDTPARMPALAGRELLDRIARDHVPFQPSGTNFWLEAHDLNLRSILSLLGLNLKLPESLPTMSITIIGDGENVRTRGQLDFPKPLNLNLEKWNIPTNLISSPLTSFTAIRGFGPWLASLREWNDLQIGSPPNQLYMWALQALAMQTYFAAPQPDASNQVSRLSDVVLQKGAAFFATNDISKFERSQTFNGLQWKGLPAVSPFLKSWGINKDNFLFGGLFVHGDTNLPPPAELLQQVLGGPTNLVCYDWELTGPRSDQWNYVGQFFRFASFHEQMNGEMASRACLDVASSKLGNCGTVLTLTAPNQLSFVRRSSIGFTAFELHLLADWLESPDFPHGLHSFIPAPPIILPPAASEKPVPKNPKP